VRADFVGKWLIHLGWRHFFGCSKAYLLGKRSPGFHGKEDSESDQIKFWLSDCEFAYGDFRDEESAAHKFEGFLVVGSKKGDTLSLF
jgi:hypothetical protein